MRERALAGCSTPAPSPTDVAAAVEADLTAYLEHADPYQKTRAVLVYHEGEPVLERYTGATKEDYWDLQSVGKSIIGTLIGVAIEQGHLDGVDQTLGELLAERAEAGTTEGSFAYSSAGSHLLAAILVQATGRSVLDYARATLFDPLGIPSVPAFEPTITDYDTNPDETLREYYEGDFAWPVDPQGVHEGSGGLRMRPSDLAAIGLLYLQDGQWDGEQVIPADWLAESTTRQVDVPAGAEDYGYQWWVTDVDDAAFLAQGTGGQLIAVVPDRDLVVVAAAEFDLRDPVRYNTVVGSSAAIEAFRTWIAPHFAQ